MGERRGAERDYLISTDKGEALFAYPEILRKNKFSFVNFCKRPGNTKKEEENETEEKSGDKAGFEAAVKMFVEEIKKTKALGTDPMWNGFNILFCGNWIRPEQRLSIHTIYLLGI